MCVKCAYVVYIQDLQVLVIPQFSTAQQKHQAPSAQLSVGIATF